MTLTLLGEPRSTNHVYKSTCARGYLTTYLTPAGRTLKEDYQWQARRQWQGAPLDKLLSVEITLYFGTRRRGDWDNYHKLSCDALNGIVWTDDSLIDEATVRRRYDKENPRIEITIH